MCKNINFDTAASKPHLGIITSGGQLPIGTGNTSPTPEILAGSITSPDFSLDIGYSSPNITAQINPTLRSSGGYYQNLGMSYDAGTGVFSITSADGSALSASNPAFITFQSKSTPGELITLEVTANQSFIDDNGSSEIIGNLFGWTTGVEITVDVPFFVYAVLNDDEDAVQFMICRVPGLQFSNNSGNIGTPSNPIADSQGSFFSFDDITITEWDTNPCSMIGSLRMRMSASDDWTVQTLDYLYDGIGAFQESNEFEMPLGQLGANAGTITLNNGGTAPVFTTTETTYKLTREGYVFYRLFLNGDGGTDGVGGVGIRIANPFIVTGASVLTTVFPSRVTFAGGNPQIAICQGTLPFLSFRLSNAATEMTWSQFTNGNRNITATCYYNITPSYN